MYLIILTVWKMVQQYLIPNHRSVKTFKRAGDNKTNNMKKFLPILGGGQAYICPSMPMLRFLEENGHDV